MAEDIREQIANRGLSLRGLFDRLDWLSRGFLTATELRRYFDNYYPTETEAFRKGERSQSVYLEALVRRFNKDKLNGRISLPEFLDSENWRPRAVSDHGRMMVAMGA